MSLSSTLKRYIYFAIPRQTYSEELIDAIDSATNSGAANTAAIAVNASNISGLNTVKQDKLLTGYVAASSPAADVLATDTLLVGLGKLQTQVTDLGSDKQDALVMAQATTSAIGEVSVTGMTAAGVVIVTPAESLGAGVGLGYVAAGVDKFTVYGSDGNALNAKLVNYIIVSL